MNDTRHTWQACDLDGNVLEITTDKPMPMFDGTIIKVKVYSQTEFNLKIAHNIRQRLQEACICNVPENRGKDIKCPMHGKQRPTDVCPKCGKFVLGGCPQGEYCTSDECDYYA